MAGRKFPRQEAEFLSSSDLSFLMTSIKSCCREDTSLKVTSSHRCQKRSGHLEKWCCEVYGAKPQILITWHKAVVWREAERPFEGRTPLEHVWWQAGKWVNSTKRGQKQPMTFERTFVTQECVDSHLCPEPWCETSSHEESGHKALQSAM